MLNVHVQITGDKETIAKLNKLKGGFSDWKPELNKIADWMMPFYSQIVFAYEGAPIGEPWAALSPQYKEYKRDAAPGKRTLDFSGTMKGSFKTKISPMTLYLGNTADYAKFHQFGTRKMPQRMMLKIDRERKDKIVDTFRAGIAYRIKSII